MRTCIRSQTKMAMMWLSSNNTDGSMSRVFGKNLLLIVEKLTAVVTLSQPTPHHTIPTLTPFPTTQHTTPHCTTPHHGTSYTTHQHNIPHHLSQHITPPATPHHLPHATKPHYTTPPLTYLLTFPRLALISDFMSFVTHLAWN